MRFPLKNVFFFILLSIGAGNAALSLPCGIAPKMTRETCRYYIEEEAKSRGLDAHLLEAIAHIESKLSPYMVNASGAGYSFKNREEAIQFIKTKQQQGCQNISVGPMQLHLPSHRRHFKSLEEMFEPQKNIRYAAKLLARFKRQTGCTEKAVKMYHTGSSLGGEEYKNRVFGAWAKIRKRRNTAKPDLSVSSSASLPSSPRVKIKFGVGAGKNKKQ